MAAKRYPLLLTDSVISQPDNLATTVDGPAAVAAARRAHGHLSRMLHQVHTDTDARARKAADRHA
jgi:hypothetical protein